MTHTLQATLDFFATKHRVQLLVLLALVLTLYARTFFSNASGTAFDYVLDDGEIVVRQSSVVKGFAGIPELLTTPTRFSGTFDGKTSTVRGSERAAYRPLSLITFAIEYQFFENNVRVRHAVNVALYAVCVVLVFLFVKELCAGAGLSEHLYAPVPFFCALLFAVHPLHAEVVCNVKSRDELLVLLCSLGALLLTLRAVSVETVSWGLIALAALLFALALLAKENAVTVLPVVPLTLFIIGITAWNRLAVITAPFFAVALVWVLVSLRIATWNTPDVNAASLLNNPLVNAAPSDVLPTKIAVLGAYTMKLLLPTNLSFDYGYKHTEPHGWTLPAVLSLLLIVAVLAHIVVYIRGRDLTAYGLAFMIFTMSVASNLVVYSGAIMADRFMFLPSVGFVLVLCVGLTAFARRLLAKFAPHFDTTVLVTGGFTVLLAVAIFFVMQTVRVIPRWESNYAITKAATEATPRSVKAQAGFIRESLLLFNSATDVAQKTAYLRDVYASATLLTALAPAYSTAYSVMGLYYERFLPQIGSAANADSAAFYYQEALIHEPENSEYKHDWAMFRGHRAAEAKAFDSALAHYREALAYNIAPHIALANIGSLYARNGRYGEGLPYLQRAVALNPYDKAIAARLALCSAQEAIEQGNAYLRQNSLDAALEEFKRALGFGAAADIAWLNIAIVKTRQGKRVEAVNAVQTALSLNPANATGQAMLAELSRTSR
jgi:protein O-mannosyl-transferase